jgi:hypothetical protein
MIGAPLLRASRARTCGMVSLVNARGNTREEERERRGSPSPAMSFPVGDGGDKVAARVKLVREHVGTCNAGAKGVSRSSSSALNRDGGRGEMRGRGGRRLAIVGRRIVRVRRE